jgi:hypothetical protein
MKTSRYYCLTPTNIKDGKPQRYLVTLNTNLLQFFGHNGDYLYFVEVDDKEIRLIKSSLKRVSSSKSEDVKLQEAIDLHENKAGNINAT